MILIDSNILIYAAKGVYRELTDLIEEKLPAYSQISAIEVLGYHKLDDVERVILERLLSLLPAYEITTKVIDRAIHLRQQRKMSLGDSIVAATALVEHCELYTRNDQDFDAIDGLTVNNPIKEPDSKL